MIFFRYILLLLFLVSGACVNTLWAQDAIFEQGQVIDSVSVMQSDETFALYIPDSYTESEPGSIVFIFDPAGRGSTGILPFVDAAETYGHILVCSNDVRNGPYNKNIEIINRLFATVFQSFYIDERQVYLSGFSGGARLATTLAIMTGKITGVVACGSGFSPNALQIPALENGFSYVGIVGDRDMNFQELFRLSDLFQRFGIGNEILTFEGNHRWPDPSVILRAFDWLDLQHKQKKRIDISNDPLVAKALLRIFDYAFEREKQGAVLPAVNEYRRLLRNYDPFFKLDTLQKRVKTLQKENSYKKAVSNSNTIKKEEEKIRNRLEDRFFSEINNSGTMTNPDWWRGEFHKLRNTYSTSSDPEYQKMGARIEYAMSAVTYETGEEALRNNTINKAIYCHQLRTLLLPEQAYPYYRLAMDYALLYDLERTVEYLEKAIDKGFADKEILLSASEFKKYHEEPMFQKLLNRL